MAQQVVRKSFEEKDKYQKNVPEKIKQDVGKYAMIHSTKSAITKFSKMYPKYTFRRTTANSWKRKVISNRKSLGQGLPTFSKVGRPNPLGEVLLQKVKDIIIGTRLAGGVISRRKVVCIERGVDGEQSKSFAGV